MPSIIHKLTMEYCNWGFTGEEVSFQKKSGKTYNTPKTTLGLVPHKCNTAYIENPII